MFIQSFQPEPQGCLPWSGLDACGLSNDGSCHAPEIGGDVVETERVRREGSREVLAIALEREVEGGGVISLVESAEGDNGVALTEVALGRDRHLSKVAARCEPIA